MARSEPAEIAGMTALDIATDISTGTLSATAVAEVLLARIADREPEIQAWVTVDRDHVLSQASDRDSAAAPRGPLHGVPVGIKDIIDTADLPTENGTVLDAGRRPRSDATLVRRLREAGAVIMGKTVTTELAYFAPGKTRNPHDPAHTPGGSSSGSAAAVAAGMVPLAIGTQTTGSVIRPASFCGVVGYKPSLGLIPSDGVVTQSHWLDTVGVFARSVADAACTVRLMAGDGMDGTDIPATPRFAFVRSPVWEEAEPSQRAAFERFAADLGVRCTPVDLPSDFDDARARHTTINVAGIAHYLGAYYERGRDRLSEKMRTAVEDGRRILAVDYQAAIDAIDHYNRLLDPIFDDYDAILTPATTGEAPRGLETTGDPTFCALWTLCGTPAITLPLLRGPAGLPVGVQLVGRRNADDRLLAAASWLEDWSQPGRKPDKKAG